MAAAARALLSSLGADQRTLTHYPDLGDPARTMWSNLPAGARPRAGISLGDLTERQRVLMHELLRASTSSQGYHKLTGAIWADEVLHDLHGGHRFFGPAHYYVSIFGSPDDGPWAWMLTGHHMSALFTVASDRVAFTPMFTGATPAGRSCPTMPPARATCSPPSPPISNRWPSSARPPQTTSWPGRAARPA
jgi:hypothetical protein